MIANPQNLSGFFRGGYFSSMFMCKSNGILHQFGITVCQDTFFQINVVFKSHSDMAAHFDSLGRPFLSIANNGKEAVDWLGKETFDAVLMDMQMPEMNGIQATRIIRKNESERKDKKYTPIIAMTANVLEDDRERYEKAGMDDHLAKPFRKNQLYDIVAKNINLE